MYICSVYKEFPRHNFSIEIKDHMFRRFKTLLYNHHSSKPGHIPERRVSTIQPGACWPVIKYVILLFVFNIVCSGYLIFVDFVGSFLLKF